MERNRVLSGIFLVAVLMVALSLACSTPKSQFGSGLGKVQPNANTAGLEKEMFSRLNRDRAEKGLPSLKWDSALADIARYHSHDMKQNDFFGHTSPNTGTLENRLVRAAYLAEVARENVAIAPNVQDGQDGLLRSPGHRANILSNDVTHVGIGIVPGSSKEAEGLTITQVFGKPLRAESPGETKTKIERKIAEHRRRSGLGPMGTNPRLTALAQKYIKNLDGDVSGADLRRVGAAATRDYQKKGPKGAGGIVTMGQNIFVADELQLAGELTSSHASSYGIAVRQVRDKQGRPSMIVLLLVLFAAQ